MKNPAPFGSAQDPKFFLCDPDAVARAETLALRAAASVSLYYGSVDVLMPSVEVLDVNTSHAVEELLVTTDVEALSSVYGDVFGARDHVLFTTRSSEMKEGRSSGEPSPTKENPPKAGGENESQHSSDRPQLYKDKAKLKYLNLQRIAKRRGLALSAYDEDYLVVLESRGTTDRPARILNVNYDFSLCYSASGDITARKALTYRLLSLYGILALPHVLLEDTAPVGDATVHQPGAECSGSLGSPPGSFSSHAGTQVSTSPLAQLHRAINAGNVTFPCVLKPDVASSGQLCIVVSNKQQAERQVMACRDTSLVASPFRPIRVEYRLVVVGRELRLAYTKCRPVVVADGVRTVMQLIADYLAAHPAEQKFVHKWLDSFADTLKTKTSRYNLFDVPPEGEEVVVCWKHNLDYGASPELVPPDDVPLPAVDLARRSAAVLSLSCAAVDVIQDATTGEWLILEINANPAWNHLLVTHPTVAEPFLESLIDHSLRCGLIAPV